MAQLLHRDFPNWWRKGSTVFLALSFSLGFTFGLFLFLISGDSLFSLMRRTLYGSVSIVSLSLALLLPFLFSAFAVFISKPGMLLLISFCKAFLFSLISLGVLASLGSSGWLIRYLLIFGDIVTLPILYLFWQRHISGERTLCSTEVFSIVSLIFLIGSIDFCIVSPFLTGLINSWKG